VTACQRQGKPQVIDHSDLIEKLRDRGAKVESAQEDEVAQPFFSVSGRVVKVNGEDVQVFEYASPAVAEKQAALVARDGRSVATTQVTWVATPHFFRSGKLVVLYVGDGERVLKVLEAVLGRQFAGG